MCGTGSTVVLSILNNRNAIGVELEEKFVGWAKQAIENVERRQTLTPKGKGVVICGDSRKLSEVLKEHEEEISSVLFSPPYSNIETSQQTSKSEIERRIERGIQGAVITEDGKCMTGEGKRQEKCSSNPSNIGNIKEFGVDAVLTSPPYEKTVKDHGKSDRATKINVEKNNHSSFAYSSDENNIGNQKKESYLEAMKTVYAECHKILKPQGSLILILKNFIRDKKVVPLTDHTIKLCKGVGFRLKERLLFKLPTQSFWRRLYSQKYPEVDTADLRFEHILIFEKV